MFGRKKPATSTQAAPHVAAPWSLDSVLLNVSPADPWTLGHALEGTQVYGETGAGKTSGPGRAIAGAFLAHGFGGLVLTVKPDERQEWQELAAELGRQEDLVIVEPGGPWAFNFLGYELARPGKGAGFTENIARLFLTVLEVADRLHSGGQQGGKDPFWDRAVAQLLKNAIELHALAHQAVSLDGIVKLIASAPQDAEEMDSHEWQESSYLRDAIGRATARYDQMDAGQQAAFELAVEYWLKDFQQIPDKTRGSILATWGGMADLFRREPLRSLLSAEHPNLLPEMSYSNSAGAIIILDLPTKEYQDAGRLGQILFKLVWQRAIERRDVARYPRPVFLWADEFQEFATLKDTDFQATARSARAATVYLTQSLPGLYARLGKDHTEALTANLTTRIFCANSDHRTNTWAADTVARTRQTRGNVSASSGGQATHGFSESFEYQVQPHAFTQLRKGGPLRPGEDKRRDRTVDAILFQGGRTFRQTGMNFLPVTFRQTRGRSET